MFPLPAPVSPFCFLFLFPCARIKNFPCPIRPTMTVRKLPHQHAPICSPSALQHTYAARGHRNPLPHHRDSPHIQRGEKNRRVQKKFPPSPSATRNRKFRSPPERNIIVVQHICRNVTLTTSRSTSTDVYTIMLRVGSHTYAQLYPLDETYRLQRRRKDFRRRLPVRQHLERLYA